MNGRSDILHCAEYRNYGFVRFDNVTMLLIRLSPETEIENLCAIDNTYGTDLIIK